jgi:hypothetical protein
MAYRELKAVIDKIMIDNPGAVIKAFGKPRIDISRAGAPHPIAGYNYEGIQTITAADGVILYTKDHK